ncbi:MAG: hypothetical protein ACRC1H_20290 [Caldilineaceae bacterium]
MYRIPGPVKVGLLFGTLGLLLTILGIARGAVPMQPANLAVALTIGFGVWFFVSWAVAQAARDVEDDIWQAELATVEVAEAQQEK